MALAAQAGNPPTEGRAPGDPGEDHWAQPWHSLFHRHLESERGLAPATVRNYLSDLGAFWRFLDLQGVADLRRVDHHLLRGYLHWLLTVAKPAARREKGDRDYAARSVARRVVGLRVFFRMLARTGAVEADPTLRLATPKGESRLPRFLDLPSVESLLAAPAPTSPAGLRDRALLELLYAAGLRVSEVAGLDLRDVDVEERRVRVLGKGGKERVVPFGRPAGRALSAYAQRGRPLLSPPKGRPRWPGAQEALFLNQGGGRLSVRSVQKLVRRWAGRAGLGGGVHTHTLRHTFATHLLDGGADLRVVQELLGHASPTTTEVYTHVTQAQARKAYNAAHPRARQTAEGEPPAPSA